ncbi:MAG: methyltransferase domain-containing protein [Steroidobacteraceae bacterium]|jgi:SAM-dependent methyltransferase
MPQFRHPMLVEETHDERSRAAFIASLREYTMSDLYPKLRRHYEQTLAPAYAAAHGKPPESPDRVRAVMEGSQLYTGYSLLVRGTQELLWDTLGEVVEKQLPILIPRAAAARATRGTLELNPRLPIPAYTAAVDIHVMPGGFHTEITDDDLFAGALYDRGVHVFAFGGLGPLNDEMGVATAAAVRRQFPDIKPGKILDLGCGAGNSTLPLADAFPEAEVYGLDLGAPMVRYAAARAAVLGKSIHFSQADAAHTHFPDASFDVIVSNLLLHEMPRPAIMDVLRECHRLLRPGGVMLHHDLLGWPEDPYDSFMMSWTTRHNNEPYERASGTLNFPKDCAAVGFAEEDVFVVAEPGAYMEEVYQVSGIRGARKRGTS